MKIVRCETAVVEANFDWTLVRLETDEGVVGWGECFFAPGLTSILAEFADLVVGQDATRPSRIVRRLYAAASGAGSTGGIVTNAISGIDAALWDLNARSLGVPLHRLLGGAINDSVRFYADCHGGTGLMGLDPLLRVRKTRWAADSIADGTIGAVMFDIDAETDLVDPALLCQRAADAVALGFDALKFDLDVPGLLPTTPGSRMLPGGWVEVAERLISAVREGAGPGVDIAFDCHWRYDLPSASRLAEVCSRHEVLWLEDPLPPENVDGLISLSRRTEVPLGGGENLVRFAAFENVIRERALSVVTPDLGKVGGVQEARRIAEAADAAGLSIAPHNIAGPVGTAFAAQVASTWPNLLAIEFHALDVPFFDELIGGPLIVDGRVLLTDAPGIGVDVDVDAAERWAKPGERVFGR